MPDKSGWHDQGFYSDGQMMRWHYCPASNRDTLVLDTKEARRDHERDCMNLARQEKRRREREAEKKRLAGLATYRRERQLAMEVAG